MDIGSRLALAMRPPTEEVVTEAELRALLESEASPRHYIGLEISGFLHLGSLVSTGYKINDLIEAGVKCTVFLADWHTMINDKLGGDEGSIGEVAAYYRSAFSAVCPGADIRYGSDLYGDSPEYWRELVRFAGHMSLDRTRRALTIMGRSEADSRTDLAKLLYPAMQAVDIRFLGVDIAHAGMDQRKIHMLVRDTFPKMGWKVPVALHHRLLPGLSRPEAPGREGEAGGQRQQGQGGGGASGAKMSKSSPSSGILVHDTADQIRSKIKRAWCEEGRTEANPLLEMCRQILFRSGPMRIERPDRFGGDVEFGSYEELEVAFAAKKLHPSDLKGAVAGALVPIVEGIAAKAPMGDRVRQIIEGRG